MVKGLDTIFISKIPILSVGKQIEFVFKNIGLIVLVAIFLYFFAMFISWGLSGIFKFANDDIEHIEDDSTRNFCWILVTFFHLCLVCIIYFMIDQFGLHNINVPKRLQIMKENTEVGSLLNVNLKSVSGTQQETFGTIPTTEYVFHIVLIIILIEMNSSLVRELHEVANILSHKPVENKH
jgi:hypothetical protein